MLESSYIYTIIIGMAVVTYLPRELPFLILGERRLNGKIILWLSFVPVSVMSALVFQEVFARKGSGASIDFSPNNLFLWAAIATFVFGSVVKNFFATVVFGMAFLAALRYFL